MADYPLYPGLADPDIERDINNTFNLAFLGSVHISTPSTMSESTEVFGATFDLINGDKITQERWRGRVLTWTWDGLNYHDQEHLKDTIDSAGMDIQQLYVPAPKDQIDWDTYPDAMKTCVRPASLNAYSATIRYNVDAGNARWTASMTWREVPGTCVVT